MIIWPQMSHFGSFSIKYHIKIVFGLLLLLRDPFFIDLISLQNKGLSKSSSCLNTTLRIVKFYLVQIDGHWPCQLPHWGLWPQIHRFLVMIGFWVRQSKIAKFWLDCLDSFCNGQTFKNCAYSECWQNFK